MSYAPSGSLDRARLKLYTTTLCSDLTLMAGSFTLANILVVGELVQNGKPHGLIIFAMLAPAYALLAISGGALGVATVGTPSMSATRALWALAQSTLLTLVVIYLGKISEQLSRLTFIVGLTLSAVSLVGIRWFLAHYAERLIGRVPDLVIVIVDGVALPANNQKVVIDAGASGIDPAAHDAEMAIRLAVAVGSAERVVVACSVDRMDDWSRSLNSLEARGEIMIPELIDRAPVRTADLDGIPTLVVAGGPLQFRDRIFKRVMDIVFTCLAIIGLSPLIVLIAIVVKLTSAGPVLFRQQRIGRDARPFHIIKFRTMHTGMTDSAANKLTARNDPRLTRIGAFLRRSSLDELPQLFNVLRGEMSIVGPRPHAAAAKAADKLYWEVDSRYWARHCIKPGMTGLAQVRGHRGATHEPEDLVNRLQSDLEYVTKWSIWRDLQIMVQTLAVLFHKNAY